MISKVIYCDLCGDDDLNNQSMMANVFGIVGERNSESCKMEIKRNTSEDDDFHACGHCLHKLHAKISEVLKLTTS